MFLRRTNILLILGLLFSFVSCVSTPRKIGIREQSFLEIENVQMGLKQADFIETFGEPDKKFSPTPPQSVWIYLIRKGDLTMQRSAFIFDGAGKLISKTILLSEEDREINLVAFREKYKHLNFEEIDSPQCNPHSFHHDAILLNKSLGMVVGYNRHTKKIDSISWENLSGRDLASEMQANPCTVIQ